jgi:hypothetical protein
MTIVYISKHNIIFNHVYFSKVEPKSKHNDPLNFPIETFWSS